MIFSGSRGCKGVTSGPYSLHREERTSHNPIKTMTSFDQVLAAIAEAKYQNGEALTAQEAALVDSSFEYDEEFIPCAAY